MKKVILFLVTIGLLNGFSTLEGKAQSMDQKKAGWIKMCEYDPMRNMYYVSLFMQSNPAITANASSKPLQVSFSLIDLTKGEYKNCNNNNFHQIMVKVYNDNFASCGSGKSKICKFYARFDNDPIEEFDLYELDYKTPSEQPDTRLIISNNFIDKLKTHQTLIVEFSLENNNSQQFKIYLEGIHRPRLVKLPTNNS